MPKETPEPSVATHLVEFYENDAYLLERLTRFTTEGLRRGQRVMAIATPAHLSALRSALAASGIPAGRIRGGLTGIDAEEVIERVSASGTFDRAAFVQMLSPWLAEPGTWRIYGELVTLLASRGRLDLALDLEAAGQELAEQRGIETLCAYHLGHLGGGRSPEQAIVQIERLHHGSATEPAAEAALPQPAESVPPERLVLLVDDYADARDIYSEYLRFFGVRVITAASGSEAVRLARAHAPDLILMDVRMPGMTGTEAMHVLRDDVRFRTVPIVALTAHALEDERAEMLGDGFDGVIAKPCLPQDLLAAVRDLLREAAGTAPPAPGAPSRWPEAAASDGTPA